ncbi:Fe-S-containing hydro-lyase [Proteinivorax tanatarense]|uniref:Fe-S-containing hydro-lyase n=1 Tax=Proteinivorax tanatarense TaxID=1260629 RepID=A0AAU7VIF2_9FIRM
MNITELTTPLKEEVTSKLKAGDLVEITGTIYSARDAAHKRFVESLQKGEKLPFDIKGQVIYYVGPCPAKPGQIIGSAGPTTSGRMDKYTPQLLECGLKAMIGKGQRNQKVIDSIVANKGVYFSAVGGAAALIAKRIKKSEIIAYDDLGAEGVRKMEVEKLPLIVAVDSNGNDFYKQGKNNYLLK